MKSTISAIAIAALAGTAWGQTTFTITANEAQTIQSGGPRDGGNDPFFHNAQGSSSGSFASYAASDYSTAGSGFTASDDLDSITFSIFQDNAFFTTNGPLNFYVASASNSMFSLSYQGDNVAANPGGLQNVQLVGSGQFIELAGNQLNEYVFNFDVADDSALELFIENALLNGDELRWVIAAGNSSTSATFAGIGNFDAPAPRLSFEYSLIPAPGAVAALGMGGLVATRRRRA
ncbi:MAG: hypothetical protein AAFR38_05190 [Planctomycetota bacterium]